MSGGLLLDLEPSVDVICEESLLALLGREVIDFMDLDQRVAHFHGFLDFGVHHSPRSMRCWGVCLQRHDFSKRGLVISSSMHA